MPVKKIVFINQVAGYLMKDVINVFCEHYDVVYLITGKVSDAGSPLNQKVKLYYIYPYRKDNTFHRFFSWIWATIQTIIIVNLKFRGYHLFLTSNPPTLAFLPLFCRNNYSVLIYDIYPDALVAGGFINKSSIFIHAWTRRNKIYLKKAANIFTLTETMALTLSRYVSKKRIKVIEPWASFKNDSKIKKEDNIFIKKYGLKDKFIVMYSGNIGFGHNVESIVEVAFLLKDRDDIVFVIIGEGWKKNEVEKKKEYYGLNNCLILPFQPAEILSHSLSAADIGVVSVSAVGSKVCAPSKTYNLIWLEIPIIAISETGTELSRMVEEYRIGKVFQKSQFSEMADFIVYLKNNEIVLKDFFKNINNCKNKYTYTNARKYIEPFINDSSLKTYLI